MSKRFSAAETLDILLESSGEEGDLPDCGLESSNYEGSETDSQTEFDQDYEDTDGEDSEEQDPGEVTYASKNGEIVWTATAPTQTPGQLLRVYGESWKEVDWVDLQAYIGLLLLAGVYRSHNEATMSLWNADTGRAIFRATMSLQAFEIMTRVIKFDNRDTRPARWRDDKLAAIQKIWDKWVERLPQSAQMVAAYTCKRKSNRWPMVVFSNMLDVSALNAFVLWSEINPAWNAGKNFRRRIFLEELGKALVSPQIQRRKSVPRGAASLRMLNQIRQPSSENIPGTSTATPPTKRKSMVIFIYAYFGIFV
ncbi:hypothetical protein PO909_000484 [Leuciscus waleckii]